jgi:hypothetical protein
MKEHIDCKQWTCLSEEQRQRLIPWLLGTGNLKILHYSRYFTIKRCIDFIRHYHQIDIYTVNELWCIQLFDLCDCANDQVPCVYETDSTELIDSLYQSMLWILDCLMDS